VAILYGVFLQAVSSKLETLPPRSGECMFVRRSKTSCSIYPSRSFVLALHLFNLLFLRMKSTNVGFWYTIAGGWSFVVLIVVIGPTAIQTSAKGPYFGISGAWYVATCLVPKPTMRLTLNFNRCWITSQYPQEQIFLEYFLVRSSPCLRESSYVPDLTSQEYLSAGFCLILYTSVFLRMRGNLVHANGKWSLRFLPRGESWQLSMSRDLIDSAMLQVRSCIITSICSQSINMCFVGRAEDVVVSFPSIYSVKQA
jgi:hypothetical protein